MKPGFGSFALHLLLLSFLTVLITAPLTHASIYDFTATSQDDNVSDFTLQYDDVFYPYGKFQLEELVPDSFSGVTDAADMYFPDLLTVANTSVSIGSTDWLFGMPGGLQLGATPNNWTYSQAVVPLPSALVLLGTGLIGLGLGGRWRKRR